MAKLKTISYRKLVRDLLALSFNGFTFVDEKWEEFDEYDALILLGLATGDIKFLEAYLKSDEPISRLVRDALLQMVTGEGPISEYILVTKKNPKFAKNHKTNTQKFLDRFARLRVGFAIEVFGGFEKNMHESAITEACFQFGISRTTAQGIWQDYRTYDPAYREKMRGAWKLLCHEHDQISFVPFLAGKR